MKVWIGLTLIAALVVTIISLKNDKRFEEKPLPESEKSEVLKMPISKRVLSKLHIGKSKSSEAKFALQPEANMTEPNQDLPKWNRQSADEPNSMLEMRNFKEEEKTDRPLLMLTYGSAPKPNLKIEHREMGNYNDPNENTKSPAGSVASEE